MLSLITHYFPTLSPTQLDQLANLDPLYHDWNSKINVISRKDIDNLYEHHVLHSLAIAKVITFRTGTRVMDLGTGGGFPGIPLAILFPDTHFHLVDSIGKKIRVCNEVIAALGLQNVTTQHARAEEVRYAPNPKKLRSHTGKPKGEAATASLASLATSPVPSLTATPTTSPAPPASVASAPSASVATVPDAFPSGSPIQPARFDFVVSRAVMPLADLLKIARPHIRQDQRNALPNGLIALKGGELEREAAAVRTEKLITPISDFFAEEYFKTKKVVYIHC